MFNSSLFKVSQEINNGIFDRSDPIVEAVCDIHRSIIEMSIDTWELNDPSDKGFQESFQYDFPPGYIMRDTDKAKKVIFDLLDIANGFTVRLELEPIYIYVMYHLIQRWCEIDGALWGGIPTKIKAYLKEKKIYAKTENYKCIKRWFTLENEMAEDFADMYDEDCTDESFAELMASIYLEAELSEFKHKWLGVSISDYIDLLPTDLYERVKKKHETDQKEREQITEVLEIKTQKELPNLEKEIISACIKLSEIPTITINLEEDDLNKLLRISLESSLKNYQYSVQDQTQRGYSAEGKKAGEIDIRIQNSEGFPETICECLIHKDEKNLHDHINKVIKNYNQIGLKKIFIICYSKNKNYEQFWKTFKEWVSHCNSVSGWKEEAPIYVGLRSAEGTFDCFGDTGVIRYVGVNIGKKRNDETL